MALAELFERIAGYYTEEDVAESRYTAGVRNTLRNCAHDARARATELGRER